MLLSRSTKIWPLAAVILLQAILLPQIVSAQEASELQDKNDTWFLLAIDSLGTTIELPMSSVGSLVAVDDATDFFVLDTLGNVLAEGIVKAKFRPGEMLVPVKSFRQTNNTINSIANDHITLVGINGKVDILGANGKLHISLKANGGETVISIAHLPAGLYIVKAGTQSFKFIKK